MPPPRRLQRSDECDGAPTPTVDELLEGLDTTRYTIDHQKRVVNCTSCAHTVPILGLGAGAGKSKRTAAHDLAEHTHAHIANAAQKKNDTASTPQPSRQPAIGDFFPVSESSKVRAVFWSDFHYVGCVRGQHRRDSIGAGCSLVLHVLKFGQCGADVTFTRPISTFRALRRITTSSTARGSRHSRSTCGIATPT